MSGYSLVELVIVITLVGVLSAVGISRLLRSDTFDTSIISAQLISSLRSAQQRAIGRSDVAITLQPDGNRTWVVLEDENGEFQRDALLTGNVSLGGDIDVLSSCSTSPAPEPITASDPFVLEFDSLGDLRQGGIEGSAGFPETVTTGVRICVNETPRYSVCVSRAGFAYAGDCDG